MTSECPKCKSPVASEGQRFCYRCGDELPEGNVSQPEDVAPASNETSKPEEALPEETLSVPEPAAEKNPPTPEQGDVTVVLKAARFDRPTEKAAKNEPPAPDARLRILLPTGDLFDRDLFHSDIQLGKGPRNDVVIADPAVSSAHAIIGHENGNYSIRDLGSRNGTYLNGERLIEPRVLQHGDVIGMGLSKLTFRLSSRERTEDFPETKLVLKAPAAPPLTEQSLAAAVVAAGSVKQDDVDRIRGAGAKGRRLYRALIDEGLITEPALRDLMSRTFHIPTIDLETYQIDEAAAARLSSKLARDHQMLTVGEEAGKLILAVADPTDTAATAAAERETLAKVSLRLATASQIAARIEQQFAPKLIGVLPSGDKLEYPLIQNETNIGKAAHNHIVLTDPTVSNAHAILIAREGGYSIADLGSRNGTFVNSEKLGAHAHLLRHGDTIQLGQTVLTFRHPRETAANVTAVLSPEALDEIRKRAAIASGEGPTLESHALAKPSPAGVMAAESAEETDAKKKEKKKKGKDERMRAAYVSAVSRVLAQVIAVLMSVGLALYLTRSRSEPDKPIIDTGLKGKAKLKIASTGAGIPFDGGVYEASGVVQVPGRSGVYFVDDSRPGEVLWMALDDSGRQSGAIKAIPHGASIVDPEGITYGASFFYVAGSQSDPNAGDLNALVRFALDGNHNLVGQAEVMNDLRSFLIANVPELQGLEGRDAAGGVNVEGIAYDPSSDRLMLGLRSPLAGGKALVVPIKLRDPRGQFSTANLLPPGPTIQLSIGGYGIRDIEFDLRSSTYLIISGQPEHGESLAFALWDWNGDPVQSNADSNPREVTKLDSKMKPEGVTHIKLGGRDFIFIVGDGSSYLKLDYSEIP